MPPSELVEFGGTPDFVEESSSSPVFPSSLPRSIFPETEDPVLSVVIPSDTAKEAVISSSHAEHLSAAIQSSELLAATLSPPLSLIRCVDRVVALGFH